MGDFAIDLAIRYHVGVARGDRSVLSAMNIRSEDFLASFGENINALILRHQMDLQRRQWELAAGPATPPEDFLPMQPNQKTRWVDGTPEYSFHICGLRKLFPEALFIHIVRDVTSVVRSMLNFHRLRGTSLVSNEQDAYSYWFRAASSCLLAERAYGPRIVFRLRYSDLVNTPEAAFGSLFDFLNESFALKCLAPLRSRINSSNVPADFETNDPATYPTVSERATRLWTELEQTPQPSEVSPAAALEIEAAFAERVQYVATIDSEYCRAQSVIDALQRENAKTAARAERLAREVKTKRAIIQHLRGRRQRYKSRRSLFRRDSNKPRNGWWDAVREFFRRTGENETPRRLSEKL